MLDFSLISKGFRMRSHSIIFHQALYKFSAAAISLTLLHTPLLNAQSASHKIPFNSARPKLVVILVVDQMRGDYVDKFRSQWTGGLHRLVTEGAWFHEAAYPYAATETCVGHSTISTGAFPATHGMVANEWWDREKQQLVTCTADTSVKNIPYPSATPSNAPASPAATFGDSAAKMLMPAFAEELKFQAGGATRIVTMSLKARAAITMAGHQADSVTWFESATGNWLTSSAYPQTPFVADFVKAHPAAADYGKTWSLLLPESAYLYDKTADGAGPPAGYGATFPHPLRGNGATSAPDTSYYSQWSTSPYAETYLAQMAEAAIDQLHLGQQSSTDFLGISFSSVDYVGHAFGPRSWEVQDELARLDRDLATLFAHLDKSVGRGNYVVALSADHGVAPIPEEFHKKGLDAGRLNTLEVKERIESALEPFHYAKPAVMEVGGADIYFSPGTYAKLKTDARVLQAVLDAVQSVPGVARVYTAEEVADRPLTDNSFLSAEAAGFYKPRSGDLLIVPKPYWIWDYLPPNAPSRGGTSHGTPYFYDQKVPVILMGAGIRRGIYFEAATPADIAPTLATICGITLATRDGRTLHEALNESHATQNPSHANSEHTNAKNSATP
jgi:predicted AlkP superfamily pyrophosphatase or phosphodiesterase